MNQTQAYYNQLKQAYETFLKQKLSLDMSRGKPCSEQLDLSLPLLENKNWISQDGIDTRNYGQLYGLPEARNFFAALFGVDSKEVFVGGNSSLNLMFEVLQMGMIKGFYGSAPWSAQKSRKFLCPAPGYDRHFKMTEYLGFELITIPMLETGPDMQAVEHWVQDETVKGIWCVPQYSNPDGYIYSQETVRRLAQMKPAASDFRIFWDHAYLAHHFSDFDDRVENILQACKQAGCPERPFLFTSLSKVTFAGASMAAVAAEQKSLDEFALHMSFGTIGYDKLNQLRHVQFLQNQDELHTHMKKHAEILMPKFNAVLSVFEQEMPKRKDLYWTKPKGGYFISLFTPHGCASRIVKLCQQAGLTLTSTGSAYPYGKDEQDRHIRIAPSFPSKEELIQAANLVCIAVRLAILEKEIGEEIKFDIIGGVS